MKEQNTPQLRPIKVDRYNIILDDDGLYHLYVFNEVTEQYDSTQLKFSSKEDAELYALKMNLDSKPQTLNLYIDGEKP